MLVNVCARVSCSRLHWTLFSSLLSISTNIFCANILSLFRELFPLSSTLATLQTPHSLTSLSLSLSVSLSISPLQLRQCSSGLSDCLPIIANILLKFVYISLRLRRNCSHAHLQQSAPPSTAPPLLLCQQHIKYCHMLCIDRDPIAVVAVSAVTSLAN